MISPRLALQKGDFLGSGVPYWPLELATLAAYALQTGDTVAFVDQFGANPSRLADAGDYYLQGEPIDAPAWRERLEQAEAFVLYAISYMSHGDLLVTIRWLKDSFPERPVAVLENSQAVTAYSLQCMAPSLFDAGADLLICGEPYFNWAAIKRQLTEKCHEPSIVPNVITRESRTSPRRFHEKLDRYPIPAWDLMNLDGYWRLPYSHGPKTRKFLPILTSRGCPYPCDFCVVPETNDKQWRGNDPEQVVDEMITLRDRYGVHDFQIEDLNPTVQPQRWEKICGLLIERKAGIRFYFVSGTKAETVPLDKMALFAKAGCRYLSISPESGSSDLMQVMGKSFDYSRGVELISACKASGIRTQACFLVGHPNETKKDLELSNNYLSRLVRAGLDEVAVFILAPFAGSELYRRNDIILNDKKPLVSFSPKGRADYKTLSRNRRMLIRTFLSQKFKYNGIELCLQGLRAILGVPETKVENLPRRMVFIYWQVLKLAVTKKSGPKS
jgi:radical SAM superfamily enzyme YgiQ (UPF0313 family)